MLYLKILLIFSTFHCGYYAFLQIVAFFICNRDMHNLYSKFSTSFITEHFTKITKKQNKKRKTNSQNVYLKESRFALSDVVPICNCT